VTSEFRIIGEPVPRADGVEKVTGRARYTADVLLPGTLWGKTLHSTRPHARILRIDVERARQLPGVHAVITGADVSPGLYGRAIKDMPVLAQDVVRYAGERIAAVAAEDEDIAKRALDLIEVEYDDLPAVFDIDEALAPDAPILHPDYEQYPGARPLEAPSNAYFHTRVDRGDLEAGFAEADLVIERTYRTPRQHQAYLEPHSVLVSLEGDRVHAWTSSKVPYATRDSLAFTTGIPAEQIVVHHAYIGGDFGGKGTPLELPVCYELARASGRPVRMVCDYLEEFLAGSPRHATLTRLKTGVRRDGTLLAHQVQFYVNCGAYAGYKPLGVINSGAQAAGPYRIPNTRVESIQVYTNTVPGGHMRAPGGPQATFALESHLDEVAQAVGIDPLEIRLRNLIVEGDESASGDRFQHVRAIETLQAAVDAAGYSAPRASHVGRGIAVAQHASGGGQGNALLTLRPDGTALLGTPIFDQGTGTYTTLLQIVAEELAMDPEDVQLDLWQTGVVATDSGIGGSRGTRVNTAVAHEVAQDAIRALLHLAAEQLEVPEAALRWEDGAIREANGTGPAIPWPELLARAGREVTGRAEVDVQGRARVTGFAAQVAEVSVDPETGEVRVLRFTTAHDVGRVMNPIGHQGQVNGGVVQGIGFALMEELTFEDDRVTSLSFGDYKIPSPRDIPPLRTALVESEAGDGPYLVKGIGENSNTAVAAAIANAVADAAGVRIFDLPITPEKVLRALREPRAASAEAGGHHAG
jgi:CO/xanthine dehydrogenase Mo-binding subunit